jgi:hypothetical protein
LLQRTLMVDVWSMSPPPGVYVPNDIGVAVTMQLLATVAVTWKFVVAVAPMSRPQLLANRAAARIRVARKFMIGNSSWGD